MLKTVCGKLNVFVSIILNAKMDKQQCYLVDVRTDDVALAAT